MAHLPNDALPSSFDVVVVGTGLIQSILAAAAARIGKSVLHLDGNSYYGEYWATLMYNDLQRWLSYHSTNQQLSDTNEGGVVSQTATLEDGEMLIQCNLLSTDKVTNIVQTDYNEKKLKTDDETPPTSVANSNKTGEHDMPPNDEPHPSSENRSHESSETEPHPPSEIEAGAETEPHPPSDIEAGAGNEPHPPLEIEAGAGSKPHPQSDEIITWSGLANRRKRFNFDLIPKLLYCRGQMVDLIVQSGVSRYLEFKSLPKLYCSTPEEEIVQVPCSRADVFTSTIVSMLEKRKLMKVLTFCADYDQHPSEYQEFSNRPFIEFLRSRDLTENLVHFILHSIAMVNEGENTVNGLKATQVFLQSLGRFGNAPFLYPLFGNGELPQGFCRLSAVFGGVYCLKRSVSSLVVSSDDSRLLGVICTTGQRIKCSNFIGSAGLLAGDNHVTNHTLSRAIFVTDESIPEIDEKVSLLTLPSADSSQTAKISVLQLDSSSLSTPEGIYLVHATCSSYSSSAEKDLECVANKLFSTTPSDTQPRLLWSLYYNITVSKVHSSTGLPGNVVIVSDPDSTIAYENCVEEAKRIFERLFPGEPFLPKIPDAEDIIYGEEETPPTDPITGNEEDAPDNKEANEEMNNDQDNSKEETPTNQDEDSVGQDTKREDMVSTTQNTNGSEGAPADETTNEDQGAPTNQDTEHSE